MGRVACLIISAIALLATVACSQSTPPASRETSKPSEQKPEPIDERPIAKVFREATRVHNRFRYFAEELKTTYEPKKQAALMADTRETIRPACEEMKKLIEDLKDPVDRHLAVDMGNSCARVDMALEKRDLDLLRSALREFSSNYERLKKR